MSQDSSRMANVPLQNYPTNIIPSNQLPPGYTPILNHTDQRPTPPSSQYGINQGFNSSPQNAGTPVSMYSNHLDQHSSNNSPAFNKPGMPLNTLNSRSSPHRPALQQAISNQSKLLQHVAPQAQYTPLMSAPSTRQSTNPSVPNNTSFNQYTTAAGSYNIRPPIQTQPTAQPQHQPWNSNTIANVSVPSSQPMQTHSSIQQSLVNGPSGIATPPMGPSNGVRPTLPPPTSQYGPPLSSAATMHLHRNALESEISGPISSNISRPTLSGPSFSAEVLSGNQLNQPKLSGSPQGLDPARIPRHSVGPHSTISGPTSGPANGPTQGLPHGPLQRPPIGPHGHSGGSIRPPIGSIRPTGPLGLPAGPPNLHSGPSGLQSGMPGLSSGPSGLQSGPANLQSRTPDRAPNATYPASSQPSMSSRYPQNIPPQMNYNHQSQSGHNYQNYNGPQNLTNQMSQLNVTQSGFNQLWGQQMFDLLQTRHILPEYQEAPPEIRLGHQFAESNNCSPEIFRCTINRIPETNALLQKSRLPLGILIHPFKDLNHLPVIQCTTIVRCRACRTYINPFVYFVDSKRWKCNLCYRVNDLPEEFQYDPVSKSYGDPTRRPEIKSATIEFIAPGEYMLRPPQPAVYLFLLDVSHIGRESEYLKVFSETLKSCIDQLPGDGRTQVGFICYDSHVHFYLMGEGLTRPREMTVLDIDDIFLPSPESLLVNLGERREMIQDLLDALPKRHSVPGVPTSALGAALQAAYKLMAPTGGRVTVLQTCLPTVGPGAVTSREDPNARSSKDVAHLNPATDFYKRLALECSGAQIAVDLFLISSQYSDLATLSGISKFSGGSVYYMPVFSARRAWQADQLRRMLTRYFTRKIGFEAVMRVRCTRGIGIHTFHGNFFVRSTDLLSLPNVSPDTGFGMQLTIEESLSDLQQVCFQAALLYTSSKGERRIRVHTMCLPVANNLTDILHSADQQCIVGLLTKMAVDRAQQSSLSDAREALSNVAVDTLSAHRLAQNLPTGAATGSLHAPFCLRLLPLYISALLKHMALRVGVSTRLDDRVAAMCGMKSLPLSLLMRSVYPDLYPIHDLQQYMPQPESDEELYPDPPKLHLTAERINSNGAYLLDDGEQLIIYVCNAVSPAFISDTFGVPSYVDVVDEARELPALETAGNTLLHSFIEKLNEDRPYAANVLVLRDNSPSRRLFLERLVDDRMDSAFSYYEFLQHVKSLMK